MKRLLGLAPKKGNPRHTRLPPSLARCELHYLDGTVCSTEQHRAQSCFGSQYIYFRWKRPLVWARMQRVVVQLDEDHVVYFPVRRLSFTKSHNIIGKKRYEEYRFEAYGYNLIYRKRPEEPVDLILHHTAH